MTRSWTRMLDRIADALPLPLLVLILFAAAIVAGLLWYFFPRWVPRRLPRLRRPHWHFRWPRWTRPTWRFRWRWPDWRGWLRRRKPDDTGLQQAILELEQSEEELPDVPLQAFLSLADRYAAEGRYAEAIRERLRAIVRDLVDRAIITHSPGWTVTELAFAAIRQRPALEGPLTEATVIFSEVWYAERPATAELDERMRTLTAAVTGTPLDRVGVPA